MRFREHRGSLADSLATLVELDTRAQLIEHIENCYACFIHGYDFSEIRIEPYFMEPDARCGWERTYIVSLPGLGVIGFTDETAPP